MANPYASNQGMANSMASLPGAAPPNGYPGAAPTSPPAYAASPYAPDGKQPYVVTAPQAAAVPEQPSGGGFMQGQTFGVDNSTLAAGGAALGVGALGVAALSNGRPGARRKPSFRDRSAADQLIVYGAICCTVVLFGVGGALVGVSNKYTGIAGDMNPSTDFSAGTCTITDVDFKATQSQESYDCNCGSSSSYSSSLFSYSSYSYSYYSCSTCYRDICDMTWAYEFQQKDYNQITYVSETEEKSMTGTCSSNLGVSMGRWSNGEDTDCWIATEPDSVPKDEGAADATGYTCPNPECAKITSSPQEEYDSQVKTAKVLSIVGTILLPLGAAAAVFVYVSIYCCGKVDSYLDA
eukprot:gene19266-6415_t